jgi:hypothetical protein
MVNDSNQNKRDTVLKRMMEKPPITNKEIVKKNRDKVENSKRKNKE